MTLVSNRNVIFQCLTHKGPSKLIPDQGSRLGCLVGTLMIIKRNVMKATQTARPSPRQFRWSHRGCFVSTFCCWKTTTVRPKLHHVSWCKQYRHRWHLKGNETGIYRNSVVCLYWLNIHYGWVRAENTCIWSKQHCLLIHIFIFGFLSCDCPSSSKGTLQNIG